MECEKTVTLEDFLVATGISPDALTEATNGCRLIHAAALINDLNALRHLLDAGAEIGARTNCGDSALHICARNGGLGGLRHLLDRGAEINAVNQAKETPLHQAVAAEQLDAIRELLSRGADSNLEDAYGDLALHVACFAENCQAARLLLEAGSGLINWQNASGNSALHIAALRENAELLALLLQHGANFSLMDANGKTTIDLLTETGDTSGIDSLGRQIIRELRRFTNAESMAEIFRSPEGAAYLDHLLCIDGLCSPAKALQQTSEFSATTQLETLESVISKRKVDIDRLISELHTAFDAGHRTDLEASGLLSRAAWKVVQHVLFPQNDRLLQRLISNRSLWSAISRHIELTIDRLYAKALRKMKTGVRELLRRNCTEESGQKIDFAKLNKFLATLTTYWSFSKHTIMFDIDDKSDSYSSNFHKQPMRDPIQTLVMWAILTGRLKIVPALLRQEEFDLVPLALLATTVLRSLSHRRDIEDVFVDRAGRIADICEGMAIQVIKEVKEVDNSPNNSLTISYVSLPLPNYAGYNILDLSARGCAREFIKLDIVELATDKNWYGDFFDFSSVIMRELVIISGFIPPFMLLLPRLIKRFRRPGTRSFLETVLNDPTTAHSVAVKAKASESLEQALEQVQLLPVSGTENAHSTDIDDVHRPHRHNGLAVRTADYMKEMIVFYTTPCVKFRLHAIFYFVFVGLLSYMILHDFQGKASSTEIFCYFALLGIFVEELREMISAREEETLLVYISDGWNAIDLVALACGFLAFIARQFGPASQLLVYVTRHEKAPQDVSYIFIVITTLIFWIRILFISIVLESVGVKLKMLSLMIKKDFIPFLYILFVIMLGFGIAFHALLWPNGQYIAGSGKAVQLPAYEILIEMFHRTFYTIVGEYGLDDMKNVCNKYKNATEEDGGSDFSDEKKCVDSPGNELVPYVLMVAYIVIVQVLLLNVIVAMFSKTIDMVHAESKSLWLFERYDLNQEFFKRSALPAPLNILLEIRNLLSWLFVRIGCCGRRRGRRTLIEVLEQNQHNFVYLFYLFYQSVTLRKLRPKLDGIGLEPEDFSQEGAALHQQLAEVIRRQEAAANWLDDQSEELRQQRELLEQLAAALLQPKKKSSAF